ncbi:DUF2147 domain-containing protein [Streptobacillus moniliformis]|uniref:DUF2147 domain-containing protein n=1 Tax=Streptobacillus moniliformis (strain ATCC 14647 / DSM 12112 / NCTC 10651 / 9901) TaxID=519441 RepID=D1AUT8_STRM9|nr:DUF2147 domain-containing protein [Streptobacillus moniliformis]ACZ01498.1 conserved hypothetical protein [Streptobacillus moniliformis DSM 12112]AVL43501.1 DUF2147 domain-containing protein [Streptobacillus moniliformis]QXW66179.1 DUF2147 domain-containing protein [Streptobacillus moniliformis]SQA13341.1 Uncharacterized protein conserved in bacteria [Streptobacillus moniliformis]
MKKIITFLFLLVATLSFSDSKEAFGVWITEPSSSGNRVIVEIYEKDNKFHGRILQLTDRFDSDGNLKKDVNNPDKSKQSRTLEGIDFVSGFTYNESNSTYENGTIYDPSNGKTYDSYMQLQKDGTLKVRGYIGISLIGRTQIWKRYEK